MNVERKGHALRIFKSFNNNENCCFFVTIYNVLFGEISVTFPLNEIHTFPWRACPENAICTDQEYQENIPKITLM